MLQACKLVLYILLYQKHKVLIPVAMRFKASVCGRSLAGIAGSNSAGGMDVCVVCCTVRTKCKKLGQRSRGKVQREKKNPARGMEYLSCKCCVLSEAFATGRSLVQRSSTNYGVSLRVI